MENLIIDGAKLQDGNEADLSKIKGVITEFNKENLVCGFLNAYGDNYSVTVTATQNKCFTWVFSKYGKVTSMQSIQAQAGQSYNAYSSDRITIVGISCDCYF
jgi:beta-glucanase (GH16 family)